MLYAIAVGQVTSWPPCERTNTHYTKSKNILRDAGDTKSHCTTLAQILFIILMTLAHNISNEENGQFSLKKIKILDFSKSFWYYIPQLTGIEFSRI